MTEIIKEAIENSGGTNIEVNYARWGEAAKIVKAMSSGLLENIKEEPMGRETGIVFYGAMVMSFKPDLARFFARIIN